MNPSQKKSQSDEEYRREFREIFAETGHRTLNALLIVTGGATVAFLTFIGTCLKELPPIARGLRPRRRFLRSPSSALCSASGCAF